MFAARGIAVSFSVFLLVYCGLSFVVCCAWRKIWLWSRKYPARSAADLLFGLRLLPFFAAVAITAAFTVPSFLLLEPRAIDEPMGSIPLALGICGLMLAAFGVGNATASALRASKTIALWTLEAKAMDESRAVPVLRIFRVVPPLMAAGILRPRVLLSGTAEFLLTTNELQTALRHEVAHVRRWDNLKKLLLRFVTFPGMSGLETAWLEATEMAADDAAVSNATEALDLAAAIIKLSQLGSATGFTSTDLATALVHSPAASTNARVERLIAWSDERRGPPQRYSSWYALGVGLATITVFAVTYSELLVRVHTATEWLVR
jgi:beta-lactamase regulating signal transducer with metallopeptidase domain